MQVKETENSGLKRGYSVTVPAAKLNDEAEKRIKEIAPTVKMDGFRPGKVPLTIVRKKYGQKVWGEVLDSVVSSETQAIFKDKDLRPALQPKIDIVSFKEGEDLEYTVQIEVMPQTPDIALDKIALEKPVIAVSEKDVDDGMKRLVDAQKEYVKLKKARAAKNGDAVIIDYLGKVDDVAFDGGKGDDVRLVLGSGQFIPGYEEQLVGAKVGESVQVKVTFPEQYHAENLAGKEAIFDVTVKDILEESNSTEVNDDFAKKFGFETVEKLRGAIKEQIERDFTPVIRSKMKKELFDVVDKQLDFDVPEGMLEIEAQTLNNNANADDKKPSKAEVKKTEELAKRRIRLGIYLAELGRAQKIEIGESEIREAVFAQARNFPGQEQQVLEYYQQNPQALEQLKGPILEEKVVDYIFEQVKTSEKEASIEALQKFNEENA